MHRDVGLPILLARCSTYLMLYKDHGFILQHFVVAFLGLKLVRAFVKLMDSLCVTHLISGPIFIMLDSVKIYTVYCACAKVP